MKMPFETTKTLQKNSIEVKMNSKPKRFIQPKKSVDAAINYSIKNPSILFGQRDSAER